MKKIFWITLILCLAIPLSIYAIDGSDFDVDKDGDVDGEDLAGFSEYFGKSCWYKDYDEDLYSNGTKIWATSRPESYYLESELTAIIGDCDDEDENVNSGADEICNDGIDNDCDENIDCDDIDCSTATECACIDNDGDGYGEGRNCLGADCYDNNADAFPGQTNAFVVDRGDGSFDYNCDGTEEKIGGSIGAANCQWFDTVECDENGNPIGGSFFCGNPEMILYQGECGDEIEVGLECITIDGPCIYDCVLEMGTSGQFQSCR